MWIITVSVEMVIQRHSKDRQTEGDWKLIRAGIRREEKGKEVEDQRTYEGLWIGQLCKRAEPAALSDEAWIYCTFDTKT